MHWALTLRKSLDSIWIIQCHCRIATYKCNRQHSSNNRLTIFIAIAIHSRSLLSIICRVRRNINTWMDVDVHVCEQRYWLKHWTVFNSWNCNSKSSLWNTHNCTRNTFRTRLIHKHSDSIENPIDSCVNTHTCVHTQECDWICVSDWMGLQ